MKSDEAIAPTGFYSAKGYPDQLRRIRFLDSEREKPLMYLTNDLSLPSESIALLYKSRWQIEMFLNGIQAASSDSVVVSRAVSEKEHWLQILANSNSGTSVLDNTDQLVLFEL